MRLPLALGSEATLREYCDTGTEDAREYCDGEEERAAVYSDEQLVASHVYSSTQQEVIRDKIDALDSKYLELLDSSGVT